MPMNADDPVARYFDSHTRRYDELYGEGSSLAQRLVDRFLHQVIKERYDLTFERAGNVAGKRILDIGCGSGRYSLRFALGRAEVVGVDVSEKMLEIAAARAKDAGVADRCTFLCVNFMDWQPETVFDVVTAIGLFDYITDPAPYLKKIHQLLHGDLFASFPIRWQVRALIRRLSFLPSGCPVRFYSRNEVDRLCEGSGFGQREVISLDRDYFVHGRTDGAGM
jgi:2-polyprenyl-3-methyl-5-hydroxy-6-metoxy-1,4-benzoquinol methylase